MSDATPVVVRLKELGVEDDIITKIENDLGATSVEDLAGLTEDDLVGVGMKKLPARKLAASLKPSPAPAHVAEAEPVLRGASLLVPVADDASILELLRIGGVAKMTPEDLIAAIRGAFTRAMGVNRIIPTLLERMREHAESLDEPLGTTYFKLFKASKRRQYGDVLAAFDGAITSIPEDEKDKFLTRVDGLWPVLAAFQGLLDAYRQLHRDEANDLSNLAVAFRQGASAVEYPDPSNVIASARGVIDRFNRVFGGMGIPSARAIAKDIAEEAELLRNPELPGTVGAGGFEEMIKKLGLGVPSDVRQTEINIATFALNLLKLPDQASNNQPLVILELQRLGKVITWPGNGRTDHPTGIGGNGNPPRDSGRRTTV
ncbi:MAG: hypothetical protein NUV84_05085 [Candidatus Uhrbacteria bacterium]|nr:hypothetical protein [Candidatus Uhrbacteria bacterium]